MPPEPTRAPANRDTGPAPARDPVSGAERSFIDNWGRLAKAFGMERDLGRAHALIYIALEPPDDAAIAALLGLSLEDATRHVEELVAWGVVHGNTVGDTRYYATNHDPWVWFLQIVAERHRREFHPVLHAMRQTVEAVRGLDASTPSSRELRHRAERFTRFVEDLSSLIEVFIRLGSKPMAAVLKTLAKIVPRS
jgi:HTH-type transcriptional regulator, glycine betaine synthesis regulator